MRPFHGLRLLSPFGSRDANIQRLGGVFQYNICIEQRGFFLRLSLKGLGDISNFSLFVVYLVLFNMEFSDLVLLTTYFLTHYFFPHTKLKKKKKKKKTMINTFISVSIILL